MQGGSAFLESKMPIPGVPFKPLEKYTYTGKGEAHRFMSNISHIVNTSGLCYFAVWVYGIKMIPQFMEHITAEQFTVDDLLIIGERVANLRMAFNLREGITLSHFKVPGRMIGDPPLQAGPLKGITIDIETLTGEYCEAMGWEPKTGKPSQERLEALDLTDILHDG
jgi:aldehyde:ferredoxin oxidoreductase